MGNTQQRISVDRQELSSVTAPLLQRNRTGLFKKGYPGAVHDLTVLIEIAARHTFFIGKIFRNSGSKRLHEHHVRIALIAISAHNELVAVQTAMERLTAGEKFPGEWPIFRHSILAKSSRNILPQILTKALCSEIHHFSKYVTAYNSTRPTKGRTQVKQHLETAISELLLLDQEMDKILLKTGWMVKWPTPSRAKRRTAA